MPTGIENIKMSIYGLYNDQSCSDIDSFRLNLYCDFLYVSDYKGNFIPSAYACEPADVRSSLGTFIDSIHVYSEPSYSNQIFELSPYINFSFTHTLADYNIGTNRNMDLSWGSANAWFFNQKPTTSDSFSFKFLFFKNGSIVDSSFTYPYFISN